MFHLVMSVLFCWLLTVVISGFMKRIIPEEFVRSTQGAFEHRVVCSVCWGNSWQLWLQREKKGLFMIKEDWDEFVDDNLLGPNDVLFFSHEGTMFLQVRIFKNYGEEITSAPLEAESEAEPETEPLHPTSKNFYQETTTASASGKTIHFRRNHRHVSQTQNYSLRSTPRFDSLLWQNFQQVEEQIVERDRVVLMSRTPSDIS